MGTSSPKWLVEALKESRDPDTIWHAILYHTYNLPAWELWPFTDQPGAEAMRRLIFENPTVRDWKYTLNEQAEILKRFPELKGLETPQHGSPGGESELLEGPQMEGRH